MASLYTKEVELPWLSKRILKLSRPYDSLPQHLQLILPREEIGIFFGTYLGTSLDADVENEGQEICFELRTKAVEISQGEAEE